MTNELIGLVQYTDLRHVSARFPPLLGWILKFHFQITAHPHPYNSHYNDAVHAYILSRLRPVAASTSYVHISNDQTSNGSWASPGYGVYFEGTNILVKIDGKSSDSNDRDGVAQGAGDALLNMKQHKQDHGSGGSPVYFDCEFLLSLSVEVMLMPCF